ncbi:hypothetical protein MOK15_02440 [Sphingobium sp. BYY-5]|uniref:ABC-three component system protein n=1 Tax=Sphingobium sp. BYY-5 TaxID=2926400 RepID=UPI001FA74081|nr:ABC-three component system protein [Sphingobium sp. BYY-5]MCI4588965.1 hypothetical protein [Sphingobium sp. BYY-5]
MNDARSPYSAAEQGLGFIYQPRLALLKILSLPESTSVLIEKSDDLEFDTSSGRKSLASLKHKAPGDHLTDLDTDFWKSVRVWLKYYLENGRMAADANFMLFTTAEISETSFLTMFASDTGEEESRETKASAVLAQSQSAALAKIRAELAGLSEEEAHDFYARITIFDGSPRITDIPQLVIDQHLRTIRRESRSILFERLEGWWTSLMIKVLSGDRTDPVYGYEVSDKLSAIAEEYRSDSLPITFRGRLPDGQIDAANDPRLFVEQLRDLDLSATRIQNAIIDYYRAFEQRSSWARENLLVPGEIEEYEDRLVDEWSRYREVVFEAVQGSSEDEVFKAAGRELYRWAELETQALRIRERVTEPYVVRGAFHILANTRPNPKVFWNPQFMKRLGELLGVAA